MNTNSFLSAATILVLCHMSSCRKDATCIGFPVLHQFPTLAERTQSADLIVIGSIQSVEVLPKVFRLSEGAPTQLTRVGIGVSSSIRGAVTPQITVHYWQQAGWTNGFDFQAARKSLNAVHFLSRKSGCLRYDTDVYRSYYELHPSVKSAPNAPSEAEAIAEVILSSGKAAILEDATSYNELSKILVDAVDLMGFVWTLRRVASLRSELTYEQEAALCVAISNGGFQGQDDCLNEVNLLSIQSEKLRATIAARKSSKAERDSRFLRLFINHPEHVEADYAMKSGKDRREDLLMLLQHHPDRRVSTMAVERLKASK